MEADLFVLPSAASESDARRYCSGSIRAWNRLPTPTGGEFIRLEFEAGGVVEIYTERPVLWIHPEEH
jgi:hypothetical protein